MGIRDASTPSKPLRMTVLNLVCRPAAFAVDQQLFGAAGPGDLQHIFSYREHWWVSHIQGYLTMSTWMS